MTVDKDQITVVIPVFNEEEAIGLVLEELKREGYTNILIVDNYSSDATAEIVRSKGIDVIQQHGVGKTGALKTAIEHVKTPYMVVMDGDHTYDPKDIEKFLAYIESYDEIIGSRRFGVENIPKLNRFGNRIFTKLFNLLMGSNLSDVCSGMYMLKTEMARRLEFKSRGFDVEVEIAAQMVMEGRVTEVPINYRKRLGKRKLSPLRDGFRIMVSILKLAQIYNPAMFFSILSSLACIPGLILLLWAVFVAFFYGVWHSGYALLGTLLLLSGFQGLSLAVVSLLLKRMEQRIKRELLRAIKE